MGTRPDFLIVGMERSGTHWVSAILNNHPEIASFPTLPFSTEPGKNKIGEVHFFNTLASLDGARADILARAFSNFSHRVNGVFADVAALRGKISDKKLRALMMRRYGEYCAAQMGKKKLVGESTPAYIFFLDFIDSLYPHMKKICIIRDPKDMIISWHFNLIRKNRKKEGEPVTQDFALGYLKKRIAKEYEALLTYKDFVHCLTYEGLHKDGVTVVRGLLDYLEVAYSPQLVASMIENASFEKQTKKENVSLPRKAGEEDIKSGLRKGIMGDWRNHISEALAAKIDETVCGLRKEIRKKYNVIHLDA